MASSEGGESLRVDVKWGFLHAMIQLSYSKPHACIKMTRSQRCAKTTGFKGKADVRRKRMLHASDPDAGWDEYLRRTAGLAARTALALMDATADLQSTLLECSSMSVALGKSHAEMARILNSTSIAIHAKIS